MGAGIAWTGTVWLVLYFFALILGVVVCRRVVRAADQTDALPPLPVIPPPDPFLVAYLRATTKRVDGFREQEVARLAVLALLEAGHLEATQQQEGNFKRTVLSQRGHPDSRRAPWFLQEVWRWFEVPRGGTYSGQLQDLTGLFRDLEAHVRGESLLRPVQVTRVAWPTWWVGTILFVILAVFMAARLGSEISVVLAIIASVGLGVACLPGRLSKRGNAFLDRLRSAYGVAWGKGRAVRWTAITTTTALESQLGPGAGGQAPCSDRKGHRLGICQPTPSGGGTARIRGPARWQP